MAQSTAASLTLETTSPTRNSITLLVLCCKSKQVYPSTSPSSQAPWAQPGNLWPLLLGLRLSSRLRVNTSAPLLCLSSWWTQVLSLERARLVRSPCLW